MFASFFPDPKYFFPSAVLWTGFSMLVWYFFFRDLGPSVDLGALIGFPYPAPLAAGADDAARSAFENASNLAIDVWLYFYMILMGAIFAAAWYRAQPHPWFRWSVVAAEVALFVIWFKVELDVMINNWFGSFYDLIQQALATPHSVTLDQYFAEMVTFLTIAMIYIMAVVLNFFLIQHFIFRWRTAMNNFYVARWARLRRIEGASQRVQEDTMRFAQTIEDLGESFVDSIMTLIAFLPILWGLSRFVQDIPVIGYIPQALVVIAIAWSIFGTGLLAVAGIRLPGLNFRNQRVEAAYRKELVLGEDDPARAQPMTLAELYENVRRNYFRLYLNYLYFNVARYGYLQASVLVPYIALAPTIVAAGFTLGVMQQILRAFDRVLSSFQYLVNSWSTIIELMSIYKRLRAFEATLKDQPLDTIEREAAGNPVG
ncbi:MAG TPA: peptide antibiotic transporter SbmA [Bauldia sp.]|nr:peptide antibiotic transporter SbmA [Bauldia sp.]